MYLPITRRRFLVDSGKVAFGASVAGSLLAACGDTASTSSSNGKASGTVKYWMGVDDANQRKHIQQYDVDAFTKAYPDIKISVNFKPVADVDRLIQVALPSGKGPDIVPTPGPSYALQYVNSNLLLELDQYVEKYGWKEKILPWALDSGRVNGKLYSLPGSYETMLLYTNKTLFAQKGWKAPTNRDELEALATEAMGQGIIPFMAGSADWRPSTEWFVTVFFNHYAGPDAVYQALTGKLSWKDPVFVEAIDLMNKYFQKGWFGGGVKQYFTNKTDAQDASFAKGTAAMDIEGSWAFTNWPNYFGPNNSKTDFDWSPIPPLRDGLPQQIFALAIGSTISISAKSQVAPAALEYMNWLFSTPKRVAQNMADINFEPLPIQLKSSDFPSNIDARFRDSYLTLNDATSKGVFGYSTWTFWPPKSDVFTYEGMDKVLTGDLTPAQFCAQLDDTFKKELAEGVVPPIPKGHI